MPIEFPKWVWALIGVAIATCLFMVAYQFYSGAGGSVKIKDFEIKINAVASGAPTTTIAKQAPAEVTRQTPAELEKAPQQKTITQAWIADSGWRGGGSSPEEFCNAQRSQRLQKFPTRRVVLLGTQEDKATLLL